MVAWPIKFTDGSKPGKKHPLPIDLSTENKKAKRSAYEKERRRIQMSFALFMVSYCTKFKVGAASYKKMIML
jgi:hypothetical protein